MSDARGAHPGCPGHAALASRSAGVRDAVGLSSSTDRRKPINIKRRLIIWEGNCGSIGPLILLGVAPLLLSCQTRGHFLVYSPLSFCNSAPLGAQPSLFSLHLSDTWDKKKKEEEIVAFCAQRNEEAALLQKRSEQSSVIQ